MRFLKLVLRRVFQGLVLIVLGILAAVLIGFYAEHRGHPWLPSGQWLGWTFMTAILGYVIVGDFRRSWGSVRFWLALAALLVLHALGYMALFNQVRELRPVWFALLIPAEYWIFFRTLYWAVPDRGESTDDDRNAE